MIRSEFTSRIAKQIGVDAKKFQETVEAHPETTRTLHTEPYEAVELGFEKVVAFASGAAEHYKNDNAGLDADSAKLKKENPKAFDAAGEFFFQTSVDAGQPLNPHHFVSFGDGVSAVQMSGKDFNGTLWIDTTPGEANIQSMLLRNDKTHGPNPCIAPPKPRPGEATDNHSVDAGVLGPVQEKFGADKVFKGLDDENLTRYTDWASGKTDLPFGTPLAALPQGWQEMGEFDSGVVQGADNFILGSPWESHQQLAFNKETGEVTLTTEHAYHRPTDFEGSSETVTLKRYPDGEVRREFRELHD